MKFSHTINVRYPLLLKALEQKMSNAINHLMVEIQAKIPYQILTLRYLGNQNRYYSNSMALTDMILSEVIHKRVIPNMNIIGGKTCYVELDFCEILEIDRENVEMVYRIPKRLVNNRSIDCVLEASNGRSYQDPTSVVSIAQPGSVQGAMNNLVNSKAPIRDISTANIRLVAENTIVIQGITSHIPQSRLWVSIGFDKVLSGLDKRSYLKFSELAVLAVQSDIYTNMILKLNAGKIIFGKEVDSIKSIIEEYKDSEEKYTEMLQTSWAVVDKLNDDKTRRRLYGLMVGNMGL